MSARGCVCSNSKCQSTGHMSNTLSKKKKYIGLRSKILYEKKTVNILSILYFHFNS